MGFRDEERARFHRIQALEIELEERDRKIAELEGTIVALEEELAAALEGKKGKKRRESGADRRAAKGIPKGADGSERDRWTVSVTPPHRWLWGVAIIAAVSAVAGYIRITEGTPWGLLIPVVLTVCFPTVFLFHRRHLVLDKKAGTITQRNSVLGVPWTHVERYRGQSIRVKVERIDREHGRTRWVGHVLLGEAPLFAMEKDSAIHLARRIAAFLEIPCKAPSVGQKGYSKGKRREFRPEHAVYLYFAFGFILAVFWFLRGGS